jgi:predicted metal-dependent hydrolase
MNYQLEINDLKIEVIKKNIKNMHLGVYPPSGRIRLAVPTKTSEDVMRLFVISKLAWIKKNINQFEKQERQSPREYVSGESHYFKGHRYLLNVEYHNTPAQVIIRNQKYIDLYLREGSTQAQRKIIMLNWYRNQLKTEIPALITKYEQMMGVEVAEWQIKQMKTKWGTCNIKARRIWLNLELAKKPAIYLEYVIVHELVHLLERHHNDRFKAYMDKFMPNWKSVREELNRFVI